MCNALYALPIRREGWFITNVVTGLLFSFVPNLGLTLLMLPAFGSAWQIPLLWFAVATLQFLFFFGSAVLAAYCTGKRFAMALAYALLNLFSMLAYWLLTSIYEPLLYGVVIGDDLFMLLCPLMKLVEFDYVSFDFTEFPQNMSVDWAIGSGWGYLAVCVALGLAFFGLALLCCRRRNLEAAGDFVAFRCLKPVILILYTLLVGMVLSSFSVPSLLGFSVGFFTGLMLLERSVKVFRKKTFLGIGIFLGVYIVSLLVVVFDLFGIIGWVPKAGEIKSVQVEYDNVTLSMDTPKEINDALTIHRQGLEDRHEIDRYIGYLYTDEDGYAVTLRYTTHTGAAKTRQYYIERTTQAGFLLNHYENTPEAILGGLYSDSTEVVSFYLCLTGQRITDSQQVQTLMTAILADCDSQRLSQNWNKPDSRDYFYLEASYFDANGRMQSREIRVFDNCENILAWMKEHGIDPFDE
jgi:ABC-2 type transport system permease protein